MEICLHFIINSKMVSCCWTSMFIQRCHTTNTTITTPIIIHVTSATAIRMGLFRMSLEHLLGWFSSVGEKQNRKWFFSRNTWKKTKNKNIFYPVSSCSSASSSCPLRLVDFSHWWACHSHRIFYCAPPCSPSSHPDVHPADPSPSPLDSPRL